MKNYGNTAIPLEVILSQKEFIIVEIPVAAESAPLSVSAVVAVEHAVIRSAADFFC